MHIHHTLRRAVQALAITATAACPAAGHAQAPTFSRPLVVIIPNAPGGGPDFIARLIAPRLGEALKQNVIVENRSSTNGIVGTEYVARAVADGTVLEVGNAGTHAINPSLYRKLPYDPIRDFAAVTELAVAALVLVAHPAVPARNVKELIAVAKRSPGKLNVAVAGATGELAGNALKLQAKIDMKNIPYKGGGPATIAVISGESDMTLTNYTAIASHVQAGKLKILGIANGKRWPQLPNVPTVAESGFGEFDYALWYGLFVPAKTPAATVQLLNREVVRVLAMPDIRERLEATGHQPVGSTPEQFADKVKRELEKYRKVVQDSGMQPEQ
jgi:tripartite-type tricarboxylate transporter receptor subunit TctC